MIAMRVMKTAVDQVVDVIAVRYLLVPTAGAVDVARLMAAATRRALVGIVSTDLDLVFVDVIAMRMMQMAIVQIVYVVAVLDCGVSAARAMLMVMVSMMRFVAWAHACLLCPHGNIRRPPGKARPLTILPADHESQSAWLRRVKLTNL